MFLPESIGLSVRQFIEEGNIKEALQVVLEKEQASDLSHKELLSYKLVKANLLRISGNLLEAIEIAEEIYKDFQKLGDSESSFDALLIQAYSNVLMMNLSIGENIIGQAEDLLKIIKTKSSIDLRERESLMVRIKALVYGYKGEIRQCLELNKKAYELAKDTDNKTLISISLNNIADNFYRLKEYDKAIKYAKEALEINNNPSLTVVLWTIIEIKVSKGDIKEAKVYLDQLREHSEKFEIKTPFYQYSKAKILKASLRARDRIKAEDIFKELVIDNTIIGELRILAIINLCDLYLTELRITSDPDIIKEIDSYIQELLNIAENRHLYLYLAETLLLQAKLSLLTLEFKKAKRFLNKAQKIAESYGLKRIAMKISSEHDKLLRQTKLWENLKTSEISLSERLELSGLNEQMENMVKRQMIEVSEFSAEEPVLLLIVTEGGVPFFTQSFIEDKFYEDHLFGGFITSINAFINNMFSEGLNRASFGKYTLLIKSITPFLICYIFKGDSYYAVQRVNFFTEKLVIKKETWQDLEKFYDSNRIVQKDDIPSLEKIITEIFNKKISFN